jgi:4-hydroxy-tetrahydrodipicolinate synthase
LDRDFDKMVFRGVGPALVTPMTAGGEVDLDAFSAHAEAAIAAGVDFLVPCGTTGESATLSPEEQKAVIARCVAVAAGRVPVLAGAGSNATDYTKALARGARDAGADGALVVTPYYNKPSPDGLVLHYSAVAEAGLPIIAYNVPGRTGANIPPSVTMRLAREVPSGVGIKEAAGSVGQFMEIVATKPEGFMVLSGDDHLALPCTAAGGDGLISVVANEDPGGTARLIRAALNGDFESAREEQYRLLPLIHANFIESNPGPVKAAMELLGAFPGHLRAPLAPVTEETREQIGEALAKAGLL